MSSDKRSSNLLEFDGKNQTPFARHVEAQSFKPIGSILRSGQHPRRSRQGIEGIAVVSRNDDGGPDDGSSVGGCERQVKAVQTVHAFRTHKAGQANAETAVLGPKHDRLSRNGARSSTHQDKREQAQLQSPEPSMLPQNHGCPTSIRPLAQITPWAARCPPPTSCHVRGVSLRSVPWALRNDAILSAIGRRQQA